MTQGIESVVKWVIKAPGCKESKERKKERKKERNLETERRNRKVIVAW
jgi:hypothetical protein